MSAWLCTDLHLSALVQSAVVQGVIANPTADNLWAMMRYDNLYALHCLYHDECPEDWTNVEVNRVTINAPLYGPAVWKHIRCWMYQCAEWPEWDQTYAHQLMRELMRKIEMVILGTHIDHRHTDSGFNGKLYVMLDEMADRFDAKGHAWGITDWYDVALIDQSTLLLG